MKHFKRLTSERSKLPFVHNTMERMESTVFRMAYWRAPTFSQNNNRLRERKKPVRDVCTHKIIHSQYKLMGAEYSVSM